MYVKKGSADHRLSGAIVSLWWWWWWWWWWTLCHHTQLNTSRLK